MLELLPTASDNYFAKDQGQRSEYIIATLSVQYFFKAAPGLPPGSSLASPPDYRKPI